MVLGARLLLTSIGVSMWRLSAIITPANPYLTFIISPLSLQGEVVGLGILLICLSNEMNDRVSGVNVVLSDNDRTQNIEHHC